MQFKDTVCSARRWKRCSIDVRQLAVVPVPVSAGEEPVLGAGVGVLPLLKPPGSSTAHQRSASPFLIFSKTVTETSAEKAGFLLRLSHSIHCQQMELQRRQNLEPR